MHQKNNHYETHPAVRLINRGLTLFSAVGGRQEKQRQTPGSGGQASDQSEGLQTTS